MKNTLEQNLIAPKLKNRENQRASVSIQYSLSWCRHRLMVVGGGGRERTKSLKSIVVSELLRKRNPNKTDFIYV